MRLPLSWNTPGSRWAIAPDNLTKNLMRIRVFASFISIIACSHCVLAADRCQEISDVVAQAAAMKPAVLEQLRKNPLPGTLGEPWRHLWLTLGNKLDSLRVPTVEQQQIFQTVAALHYSKKREVDFDIFREYFYLRCKRKERGLATAPLSLIPGASLTHCWDNVASRPQFQACVEKLLGSPDAGREEKPKKRR